MTGLFTTIANLLAKLFGRNIDFLHDIFKGKTVVGLATISIIIGMLATLYATVSALLAGISYIMPDFIAIPASWIYPDNFNECVTTYLAVEVAIAFYRWHKEMTKLYNYIT